MLVLGIDPGGFALVRDHKVISAGAVKGIGALVRQPLDTPLNPFIIH